MGDNKVTAYISDADETADNDVVGGPCLLHAVHVNHSDDTEVNYLKLYDNIAPVVGTTAPEEIVMIERNTTGDTNLGQQFWRLDPPLEFETALSVACVTGAGTAGTTGPTADSVAVALEVERV